MRVFACLFALCMFYSVEKIHAQTDSFLYDGIMRNYNVHVPPGFSDSDTLPMVFNLHGLLMNATSQEAYSEFSPIADREKFIVVYPNGISNSWNAFNVPYHGGVDDVGFLSALIDTVHKYYHINLNRVYSTGMSNGGFMSYRLACELSERIAAIASVTGSMTDSMMYYCNPSHPVPVMRIHGTADLIVNFNGSGAITSAEGSNDYWIQQNNCPGNPMVLVLPNNSITDNCTAEWNGWTPCDSESEVIFYKVTAGGHTWPGASDMFGGIAGATNQDFDASEAIWQFFNRYDLQGKRNPVSTHEIEYKPEISFYPNPANDFLTVEINNTETKNILLTDMAGKSIVESMNLQENRIILPLKNIPRGMYLLVCEGSGMKIVKKILLQ